jgi:hypothetical protein
MQRLTNLVIIIYGVEQLTLKEDQKSEYKKPGDIGIDVNISIYLYKRYIITIVMSSVSSIISSHPISVFVD